MKPVFKSFSISILAVFIFLGSSYAQTLNDYFSKSELNTLTQAQTLIHSALFARAESLLTHSEATISPTAYLFFMQVNYFWRFVYTKNDSFLTLSVAYGERNKELLEDQSGKPSLKNDFFLGAAYGYLGLAKSMGSHLLSAIKYGKRGYNKLKKIYETYPDFKETELGLGVFEGMVAKLPAVLRWLSYPLGIKGNMPSALKHLSNAASGNRITKADAWFFMYGFLSGKDTAPRRRAVLDSLATTYPDNPLYVALKGMELYRLEKFAEARKYFRHSRKIMREPFQNLDILADSYIARCDYRLKDYQKCIDEYLQIEPVLLKLKQPKKLDMMYAFVSKSYQALGEKEKAEQYYNQIETKKIYDRIR